MQALSVLLFHRLTELTQHPARLTPWIFARMEFQFAWAKIQSGTTFEDRDPRAVAR